MSVNVAILGYGVVGKRRRECIESNKHLNLVAVADKSFNAIGELDGGIKFYPNYKQLLQSENIDAVFVCMSNDMVAEVASLALDQGHHVFCEKPPARNLQELRLVLDAESRNPTLKLMYGFNHRYHDSVQDALAVCRSGELGNVINLRGIYGKSQLITYNQPAWRTKRDIAGGGVLLDQGIHMVDLMRLFGGDYEDVYSYVMNNHWGHDVEDNVYALMKTNSGVVGMLHSSATQWRHRFELEVTLDKGSIILGGILSSSKSYGAETLKIVWVDSDDQGDPKEQITRYNKDSSWQREVDYFSECVVKNLAIEKGASHDAFKTLELVYKIYCADSKWKDKFNLTDKEVATSNV